MNNDYWASRWHEGEIGFHRETVDGHLKTFGPMAFGPGGNRVLVPMCGKSLDLLWLERQGHEVVGVELVETAIRAFFEENDRTCEVREEHAFRVFTSRSLSIIQGDLFDLPRDLPAAADGIYDRAGYHAFETPARRRLYAEFLKSRLQPAGRILLLSVDYDQSEMSGPPYAVSEEEIRNVFEPEMTVRRLSRKEILADEPKLRARGCTTCHESVHLICRPGEP